MPCYRMLMGLLLAGILTASPAFGQEPHAHGPAGKPMSDQTLKQVMQGIQSNLDRLVYGITVENPALIREGALGIADHPMPKGGLKPYIKKNPEKLGEMVPAMEEAVHQSALHIVKSIDAGNTRAVVEHLSTMLKGCVSCHQVFRGGGLRGAD